MDTQTGFPSEMGGHRFANPALLREALTHPSAQRRDAEGRPFDSERLEFLGDSVLGLALADALHAGRPAAREGELSACRASLVSRASLARLARGMGLPALLDAGDEPGARERVRSTDSAAENAFEAVVGAVYRDAGYEAARTFVARAYDDAVDAAREADSPKNRLQELIQARSRGGNAGALIEYRTVSAEGPEHARLFTVEVWCEGVRRGAGRAGSLKAAGEAAARDALAAMDAAH